MRPNSLPPLKRLVSSPSPHFPTALVFLQILAALWSCWRCTFKLSRPAAEQEPAGEMNLSRPLLILFVSLASVLLWPSCCSSPDLSPYFYAASCPDVELLVKGTVQSAAALDPTLPGKLLRLLFHDCMVEVRIGSAAGSRRSQGDGARKMSLMAVGSGRAGLRWVGAAAGERDGEKRTGEQVAGRVSGGGRGQAAAGDLLPRHRLLR